MHQNALPYFGIMWGLKKSEWQGGETRFVSLILAILIFVAKLYANLEGAGGGEKFLCACFVKSSNNPINIQVLDFITVWSKEWNLITINELITLFLGEFLTVFGFDMYSLY